MHAEHDQYNTLHGWMDGLELTYSHVESICRVQSGGGCFARGVQRCACEVRARAEVVRVGSGAAETSNGGIGVADPSIARSRRMRDSIHRAEAWREDSTPCGDPTSLGEVPRRPRHEGMFGGAHSARSLDESKACVHT